MTSRILHAVAFSLFTVISAAAGEKILDDNFDAAGETEAANIVESKGSWTSAGNRTLLASGPDADGLKSGNALIASPGFFYVKFPDVELKTGDALELSFRFRCDDKEPGGSPYPLRAGLFYSEETPDAGNAPAYWLMARSGANGDAMLVFEEGTDQSPGGGQDLTTLGGVFAFPSDRAGVNTVRLVISRPAAETVELSSQLNDASPAGRQDPKASITRFNTLGFRLTHTTGSHFYFDDVSLTSGKKAN